MSQNQEDRRTFIKAVGATAVAGPFLPAALQDRTDHYVPADKKLDPAWVRSLFERGTRKVYRGKDRAAIGMPVGGIGAGQIYIGGDGTLRLWEIMNKHVFTGYGAKSYEHYVAKRVVDHGFAVALRNGEKITLRRLREEDVPDVEFIGEYPLAEVTYPAGQFPIRSTMRAFSPFVPLNSLDSTLPTTFFQITLENTSDKAQSLSLLSWLENATARHSGDPLGVWRTNAIHREEQATYIACTLASDGPEVQHRPPEVFADFEGEDYGSWRVRGQAFGKAPAAGALPSQNKVSGFEGKGLVNSFVGGDQSTGRLTSKTFTISRPFINFLIGGGSKQKRTCINLLIGGRVRLSTTGQASETLSWAHWDVSGLVGKKAQIQIVDRETGSWGHVSVDQIEFADAPKVGRTGRLSDLLDYGEMGMVYFDKVDSSWLTWDGKEDLAPWLQGEALAEKSETYRPRFVAVQDMVLEPGTTKTLTAALIWYFPNHEHGRRYATHFRSALDLARYLGKNHKRLVDETLEYHRTYYDSSLPHWLLDRIHAPVSTLATNTVFYRKNGRIYGYEGVGCCSGTCTHVWNYEHALARLFPDLSRSIREMQDLGEGFLESGMIAFRGTNKRPAIDGQAGTVLKIYREHLVSKDDGFLRRNWPRTKKAIEYLIDLDANEDGLLEGQQHNTYDISFYGPNTFVGSLYLAALRAGEEMARHMGEGVFAKLCSRIFLKGSTLSVQRLFNGHYFEQKVDHKAHPRSQYGNGCLADQLFGQGWAHQVGLGYIYPQRIVHRTLKSIYVFNWAPDVGPQNARHLPERYFARQGDGGLFMCTWPRSRHPGPPAVRYKNEIWTGIEYQVAGHMIWEGMVEEALIIIRALHDRYDGRRHNPFNEVECGDHYARALASWGCLTALSGFAYDGPAGQLSFAPRLLADSFRCLFTSAQGWGTLSQTREGKTQSNRIYLRYGKLDLQHLGFELPPTADNPRIELSLGGKGLACDTKLEGPRASLQLKKPLTLVRGDVLLARAAWSG